MKDRVDFLYTLIGTEGTDSGGMQRQGGDPTGASAEEAPQKMLLRRRIFEEVNLQLVAKLHGANSKMLIRKLVQAAASPHGKRVPGVEINS